ncbi:MAG: DUF1080 domain-containing protein [Planctomycetaceae bacterium]
MTLSLSKGKPVFEKSLLGVLTVTLFAPAAWAQSYTNLLDGDGLQHWMTPGGGDVGEGWKLEPGGVLHKAGNGGNIITREKFGDFELWFEFRISAKGNSGIKYRVDQYGKSWLGLEYQVLDDAAFPKLTRDHHTGSLYDLVAPIPAVTRLNAEDQYNVGKIRVAGQRAQHWVNGQLLIDEPLTGPRWKNHVANSKFKQTPGFGENPLGHLMLTDHHSEVWYRNIYVRRLDTESSGCPARVQQVSLQPSF